MNILYFNHYIGSFNEPKKGRPYYLNKKLQEKGNNLTVVGSSYHKNQREPIEIKEHFITKIIDDIKFVWVKSRKYQGNGLGRLLNMFDFSIRTFFIDPVVKFKIDKPDVIVASSAHPFHIFSALRWAKKYDAKFVYEVRDPWPMSLNQLIGLKKYHPFSIACGLIQRLALSRCYRVISTAKNLDIYFKTKGLENGRYIYACNGVAFDSVNKLESSLTSELSVLRGRYKRVLMYTGAIGTPNAMEFFIQAMNSRLDDDGVCLVLIGNGVQKDSLKAMSLSKHVYFYDAIPKDEIQAVLSFADVCVISWLDKELYKYGVSPNKVFDYMLAKKPILQAINSPNNQVQEAKCGVNVMAQDVEAISDAIESISLQSDDYLKSLGCNGYSHALKYYSYDTIATNILNGLK